MPSFSSLTLACNQLCSFFLKDQLKNMNNDINLSNKHRSSFSHDSVHFFSIFFQREIWSQLTEKVHDFFIDRPNFYQEKKATMKTKFLSVYLMENFDLFYQSESFLNILHNFFQRHYKSYLLCCFHSTIPSYFFLNRLST